jgi:hypothetical protein
MQFVNPFDTKAERNEGAVAVRRKQPTSYDSVLIRVRKPISQKSSICTKKLTFCRRRLFAPGAAAVRAGRRQPSAAQMAASLGEGRIACAPRLKGGRRTSGRGDRCKASDPSNLPRVGRERLLFRKPSSG